MDGMSWAWLFVCFITKSFLTYSFLHLHLLYQPYLRLCQATCVQSHQRQPRSAVAIATWEVQVSAANYQTVPTVATGVSKPRCCRLTLTFTLTSENLSLCTTLLLLLVFIQLCSPRYWHLDSNYCRTRCRQSQLRFVLSPLYCICVCWGRSNRIFHFSRWLGQLLTVLTKDESPHTGYTFTPWVMSFTPPNIEH